MNTDAAPAWLPKPLIPFFTLSYPTPAPAQPDSFPNSNYYDTGLLDVCIIVTAIAVMAILRDATRLFVMEPFARWKLARDLRKRKQKQLTLANGNGKANGTANGLAEKSDHYTADPAYISPAERKKMQRSVIRFAEQGWPVVYYPAQLAFGLVRPYPRFSHAASRSATGADSVYANAPLRHHCPSQYVHGNLPTTVLNPINVWTNYPHIPLATPIKFYYLLQTAFYMHQVLIINAEAPRKDHWQMMAHHVITIALMVGSYFHNYTRVGCLIMVLMDWCDLFLPVSLLSAASGMTLNTVDSLRKCFGTWACRLCVTRHLSSSYWYGSSRDTFSSSWSSRLHGTPFISSLACGIHRSVTS